MKTAMAFILTVGLVTSGSAYSALAKEKPKAPTGALRQKQFNEVLKWCRQKYGGGASEVSVEWGTNYGKTSWWCVTRG